MAEREDADAANNARTDVSGTPEQPEGDSAANQELPAVESPPLSPAAKASRGLSERSARELIVMSDAETEETIDPWDRLRIRLKPREKRQILLAALVALAAAMGAVIGAIASHSLSPAQHVNIVGLEERQAMQRSIAHLSRQVAALKASLAAANQSASNHIAKTNQLLNHGSAEITGSVAAPAQQVLAPLPRPRPRSRSSIAPVEDRLTVLPDWWIRDARGGFVYVQGHGNIYQVVPGALLPGLGPVRAIRWWDGRWMVVTPKGIIVSLRDRSYFE